MQSGVLFSGLEKRLQRLSSEFFAHEQLWWPSLQRLTTEVDFDRRRPTRGFSNKKVAPRVFMFIALDHEAPVGVPLHVKERKLRIRLSDRGNVPHRSGLQSRDNLRNRRNW